MKDLIEALTILSKYTEDRNPTHCEHDVLAVMVDPARVPPDEIERLETLGFIATKQDGDPVFISFRFGSC